MGGGRSAFTSPAAKSLPAPSAGFGQLTNGQQLTRTIPGSAALTPAAEWKVAGTSIAKVNGRDIVTGAHKYTYDLKRPGMQWGKVLYPPSFGATLQSFDSSAAEAMPGVKVVHEGDFVGVTAPDPETAASALASLKAEWKQLAAEASSKESTPITGRPPRTRPTPASN